MQYKTTLLTALIALTAHAAFGAISVSIDNSVSNQLTFSLSGSIPSGAASPGLSGDVLMIHRSTGGSWAPGGITASNFINNGMNIGGDALSSVPTQLLSISGWGPTDLFSLAFAGQLAQNDVVNNGTNAFTLTLDSADYAAFNAVPSFDIMWGFAGTVSGSFVRGADVGSVAIVPEPSSALLGGIGMLALMLRRRAV